MQGSEEGGGKENMSNIIVQESLSLSGAYGKGYILICDGQTVQEKSVF